MNIVRVSRGVKCLPKKHPSLNFRAVYRLRLLCKIFCIGEARWSIFGISHRLHVLHAFEGYNHGLLAKWTTGHGSNVCCRALAKEGILLFRAVPQGGMDQKMALPISSEQPLRGTHQAWGWFQNLQGIYRIL